jgi:two-component system, NarL family, capsular synthesis sensor histidine kinase RcsC
MKQAKLRIGALALSSLRQNKLLLVLAGLALFLVGMSYWAVNRILNEELDKTNFHFARLMESIQEHEGFLKAAVESYGLSDRKPLVYYKPALHEELKSVDNEVLFQNSHTAKSLPFTVSQKEEFSSDAMHGVYSFGIQLSDLFAAYWSDSYYAAPQIFVMSPGDAFTIAVPGINGTRQHKILRKSNFYDVTHRIHDELLTVNSTLSHNRLVWLRAPSGLIQKRKYIVGAIKIDLSNFYPPLANSGSSAILTTMLDLSEISDLERLLMRPTKSSLTLISPTGDVLVGTESDVDDLPFGLSLTSHGMHFKLSSGGTKPWIGLYIISYQNFFGYAKWPLTIAFVVFFSLLFIGWWINRWYREQIIEPAQRSNLALTESDEFNRAMLDNAPVGLYVVERTSGVVLLENLRAKEWDEKLELLARLNQSYDSQQTGFSQFEVAGRHIQSCFTFTRYQGKDVVLVGFNDITQHIENVKLLEQARHKADEASKAKTLFLATMSHEIRTPLYGVLGNLELLELTSLSVRQSEYLKTIQRSSKVLFQLISDVLDVSKIESGQMAVDAQAFSPVNLFEDCIRSYAAAANNGGLKIFSCIDSSVPTLVCGDHVRIRQIIDNLLSNSIKFTDLGHVAVRLKVTDIGKSNVAMQWQVSDTGVGISRQQMDRIFKPFSQVGQKRAGGAGLGLSICAKLSEMMGASLHVVSEPGLGSSFTLNIRLPIVEGLLECTGDIDLHGVTVFVRAPLKDIAESLVGWLRGLSRFVDFCTVAGCAFDRYGTGSQ